MTPDAAQKFWSLVDRSGGPGACWPWRGPRTGDGYAKFQHRGRKRLAHLVACELALGPLQAGKQFRRRCANKLCCNPSHVERREPDPVDGVSVSELPREACCDRCGLKNLGLRHTRTKSGTFCPRCCPLCPGCRVDHDGDLEDEFELDA